MSSVLQRIKADLPIFIITDESEDVEGVVEIVKSCTKNYRVLDIHHETQLLIESTKPKILMLAATDIKESVHFYAELIRENIVSYSHKSILLCDNKSSGIAFDCCINGLFDDYCVYKPLYENYRLRIIIYNAMRSLDFDRQEIDKRFKSNNRVNANLEKVISLSAGMKKSTFARLQKLADKSNSPLIHSLEQSITKNLDAITKRANQAKSANKESMSSRDDYIDSVKKSAVEESLFDINEQSDDPQEQTPCSEAEAENTVRRVLVAEDNPIYRKVVVSTLENNGFEVTEVDNGLEVVSQIGKHIYDAIILDLFMPKLDGIEVTERIRRMEKGGDVPIIALTGNSDKEYVMSWLTAGLTSYLVKPSSREKILNAVEKAIAARE